MELKEGYDTENDDSGSIAIKVKQLKVWTPEEKSWWRRKPTKNKTIILDSVTGSVKENEFVAILGPSGAGKTTFLGTLAGKSRLPCEGSVMVYNTDVKDLQPGVVEIVPQFDMFIESLTVVEHLMFMTEMKLGNLKSLVNRTKLNMLIDQLQLKALAQTRIQALSGGQRKLLSLASSLISNPPIIICDEPTTGLDSYNASLVIAVLKRLTYVGKIVICSVHQPSSNLFNEFDSIMLMAEGKLLFHGTQEECYKLFKSINFHCPRNYNPAEFYIKMLSSDQNCNRSSNIDRIWGIYCKRFYQNEERPKSTTTHTSYKVSQRFWLKQVHLLLWRSSLTLKRKIKDHVMHLLVCLVSSAIVVGTCFVGISGTTQTGTQDLRGFLWLLTSEVSYNLSYNSLYIMAGDLALFRREVGTYQTSAFFVSRLLNFIPRCLVWTITYVVIAALAVDLPNHIFTALQFILVLTVTSIGAAAYGLGMGALFGSTGLINDVMPTMDLPLFLMSGTFLRLTSLPLWLLPVRYVSHFYYGMDAMSNIYWRQIDRIDCPSNYTSCVKDGLAVLKENGYSDNFVVEDTVGLLFVIILWSVLGYVGLKREERKGYVY